MDTKLYCITIEDGLALMVSRDHTYLIEESDVPMPQGYWDQLVMAFIINAEDVADCTETPRTALRFHPVRSDAEAVQWFESAKMTRFWEPRH